MKCVILAGGYGTRFSEETYNKPKPMIEIGGMPILWHIMKIYEKHKVSDFIICLGYKGYLIKEFFANYVRHRSDMTVDFKTNTIEFHKSSIEPWNITLVDTGTSSLTGGRLLKVKEYLSKSESFCFTYGDGLADLDISEQIKFHSKHNKIATVCAVQAPNRYGVLDIKGTSVKSFEEKPSDSNWINGGFFVLKYEALDYIENSQTIWEKEPLNTLTLNGQLEAYRHSKFWHPMDTLRDHKHLQELWHKRDCPWKIW